MAACATDREGYSTGSIKVFIPKTSKDHVPDLRFNAEITDFRSVKVPGVSKRFIYFIQPAVKRYRSKTTTETTDE